MAFIKPFLTARSKVGLAVETTPGTFRAATKWLPVTTAKIENDRKYYEDKSYRGRASESYGHYRLVATGVADYGGPMYPDATSLLMLGVFGQDKITAAAAATTIVGATTVGAFVVTLAAGQGVNFKKGMAVLIDASGPLQEGNIVLSVATDTLTCYLPWRLAHLTGVAFVGNNLHDFRIAPNDRNDATLGGNSATPGEDVPHLSISDFYNANKSQIAGAAVEDLAIKWNAETEASYTVKLRGLPLITPGTFDPTLSSFSRKAPFTGWQAGALSNGVINAAIQDMELNFKRKVDPVFGGNNQDGPVAIISTRMHVSGKFTALFNNLTEYNHFENSDNPKVELALAGVGPGETATHTPSGLLITMSQCAYIKVPIERGKDYVQVLVEFVADDNSSLGGPDIVGNGTGDDGPAEVYMTNDYTTLM